MKHQRLLCSFCISMLLLLGLGCKDQRPEALEYDRAALTANIGGHVIMPAYNALLDQGNLLKAAQTAFRQQPTVASLDSLQSKFATTWIAWKGASAFEFGPAATRSLRTIFNTFPSDTVQIHSNFATGTWDLNLAANTDARGFPALDFILHGLGGNDTLTLARFLQPADSLGLQNYLAALVDDVQNNIVATQSEWVTSYLSTFKGSLGTDVGSSTSFLVNEISRELDILKNASIGIPLGKLTFDVPIPEKVEGYFSGLSKPLLIAELSCISLIFEGQNVGATEAYGLHEALVAVDAQYQSGSLGDAIHNQFSTAQNAVMALPVSLSDAVMNNRAPVEAAYVECQKLLTLLKTDLASVLSILITYTDADGD